jgi:hypothetical protein
MKVFQLRPSCLFLLLVTLVAATPLARAQDGRVVSCSSDDMRRHFCEIGPNDGVRLARRQSDARCVEGQSYGVRGRQMWVDRGCRAEFYVIPERRFGGPGRDRHDDDWRRDDGRSDRDHREGDGTRGGVASTSTVYCASDNMRRNYCQVGSHQRIRLVRKRSDAACDLNRTYGFDGGGIWVDRGCRAEFEVLTR